MSEFWSEVIPDDSAWERRSQEAELVEYERDMHADRLRRDDPAAMWCAVCGVAKGQSIYGLKCRSCFEAQKEERET